MKGFFEYWWSEFPRRSPINFSTQTIIRSIVAIFLDILPVFVIGSRNRKYRLSWKTFTEKDTV